MGFLLLRYYYYFFRQSFTAVRDKVDDVRGNNEQDNEMY
jgi:hypothetical protein